MNISPDCQKKMKMMVNQTQKELYHDLELCRLECFHRYQDNFDQFNDCFGKIADKVTNRSEIIDHRFMYISTRFADCMKVLRNESTCLKETQYNLDALLAQSKKEIGVEKELSNLRKREVPDSGDY